MSTRTVQIELPPNIYDELADISGASTMSLEEVVLQTIKSGMPPSLGKVPAAFHDELISLNGFPDKDLLRVVEGDWPAPETNDELHRKADFTTLRRMYALSLLRWRGHPIPNPYEM